MIISQVEKDKGPEWVCSEDPPSHSQFIRRAQAEVSCLGQQRRVTAWLLDWVP